MKKKTVILIALLVLPFLTLAFAITPGSVTVIEGETVRTTTYGEAVVGSAVGWCAPVALIMTYGLFAAAVIYCVNKKRFWLKAICAVSFVAMTLAVLPVILTSEVIIIPNVFVGILLGVLYLVSHFALKKPEEKKAEEPKGARLPNH